MTPEEAKAYLDDHSGIEIVEQDLNPDDPRMGRAQFLVSLVAPKREVESDLESIELELFDSEGSPPHLFHITLPPQE